MKLSILILSWNRPLELNITLKSLFNSLGQSTITKEVLVFDQGSNERTLKILERWEQYFDFVEYSKKNIGMSNGWKSLLEKSKGDYIMFLENDWFCDSCYSNWLTNSLTVLDGNKSLGFLKLRALKDKDNYGFGLPEHSPWTRPKEFSHLYEEKILNNSFKYFITNSKHTGFTFNPILAKRSLINMLLISFYDNPSNKTPLRSGEDQVDHYWRDQNNYKGGAIFNGPFKHIGFHNRRNQLFTLPIYILKLFIRELLNLFRGSPL